MKVVAINEIAAAAGRSRRARTRVLKTAKPMKGYPSFATGTCGVSIEISDLFL
jgi:hypothetical protein